MQDNRNDLIGLMNMPLSEIMVTRRSLLKRAALVGVTFPIIASLITACEADDGVDDTDEPTADDTAAVEEPAEEAEEPVDEDEDPDVEDEDPDVEDEDPTDEETAAAVEGGDVSVMYWGPNDGLSPMFGATGNTQQIVSMMFGTLVKMNDVLEPIPDLAESVEVSDDAMEYTFELHEDVYFNDGEQLTSSDVRFTYETVIDPTTGSYWGPRLYNIEGAQAFIDEDADNVSGIETPDDFTVVIHMDEPSAVFQLAMTQFTGLGIAPEHVLADVPRDQLEEHEFNWAPTVSAGAFQFHDYQEDQYLELHRYEDYFRGAPAVERIFVRDVTHDVGVAQLETGELDVMSLPVGEVERVENIEHVNVESMPSPSVTFIALNLTEEKFQDVRVRQAMMYAVDRQGIVESILGGHGEAVHQTIIGPDWFGTADGLNPYEHDPDLAREMLEEAAWNFDEEMEILVSTAAEPELQRALTVLQEQWAEVGIQAEISYLESAAIAERVDIDQWNWDAQVIWGGVFRADPHISSEYFHTRYWRPDGNNYGHYSNDRVDELFDQGQEVVDEGERIEIYTEIAQILNEELPWIFLYSPDSLYGVSNRLQGFQPASYFNNKFWNAHEWSVSE
jgi:ABC-type transport system substrate-binding protein